MRIHYLAVIMTFSFAACGTKSTTSGGSTTGGTTDGNVGSTTGGTTGSGDASTPVAATLAWVSGQQLWLKFTAGFTGTLDGYSLSGACSSQTQFLDGNEAVYNGAYTLLNPTTDGSCGTGAYTVAFTYTPTGGSQKTTSVTASADTAAWSGGSALSIDSTATSGNDISFSVSSTQPLTIYQVHIYDSSNRNVSDITYTQGINVISGANTITAGSSPPSSGNYAVAFYGLDSNNHEYWQYTTFTF